MQTASMGELQVMTSKAGWQRPGTKIKPALQDTQQRAAAWIMMNEWPLQRAVDHNKLGTYQEGSKLHPCSCGAF